MKKLPFIFMLCYFFMSCTISGNPARNSILLVDFKPIENVHELIILQNLTEIHEQESVIIKNYSPYSNILRIFIFSIIIVIVFVVISTPLLLVYFWVDNFFDVQTSRNQIKKSYSSLQFTDFGLNTWSNYKNSYSEMYGNAFGIFAWVFFTYVYVSIYYYDFNTGIADYFRFPFKVMDSLSDNNVTLNDHIPPEMWVSMVFIVGISAAHYFLGRFIGRLLSANFHKKRFLNVNNNSNV